MPKTPDRRPGPLEEDEGIYLSPQATAPTVNGELRYVAGAGFRFYEEGIAVGLSGSGISAATHENLDTLVHEIAETCYEEIVRDGNSRPQFYRVWTDNTKTVKVREIEITRDGNNKVASIILRQYDSAGALVTNQTITKTMTRALGRFSYFDSVQS